MYVGYHANWVQHHRGSCKTYPYQRISSLSRCVRLNNVSTHRLICWKSASLTGFRAIKSISHPGRIESRRLRTTARNWRLTRFLLTAFPIFRPTAKPIRTLPTSLGNTTNTMSGWAYDLPYRLTRWKSADLVNRNLRFTL